MLSGRPFALVLLAWSLFKVIVKQLFGRPRPGIAQFHENYDGDGLRALDQGERERLARFSGCVACGRCDVGEAERVVASRGQYPGLMQLVLASSRSMPDYDAAARGFSFVPEAVLRQKSAACPARIPFAELAAFVRAKSSK